MSLKRRLRRLETAGGPADVEAALRYGDAQRAYTRRKLRARFAGVPFDEEAPPPLCPPCAEPVSAEEGKRHRAVIWQRLMRLKAACEDTP